MKLLKGAVMKSVEIREFRQAITNFVNENEFPDEVKRMVLLEVLKEQEEKTIITLKKEIEQRNCKESAGE